MSGLCRLTIKSCKETDISDFTCKLDKQEDKTSTKVSLTEYPYKFVKVLKSQQLIEKDNVTLLCELNDASGEVKWYKGEEEIVPDKRMVISADGRKRKLVIKDCKITDAGMYKCVSNADKTEAELVINYLNKFNKKLKDSVGIEDEKLVLEIELQDKTAEAEWFLNGKPITPSDRVEIKNLGGGKHQLIFNKLDMNDAGEITCKSGNLESSCQLNVKKAESKPIITAPDKINEPATKPIVFEIPYKIDGTRTSPVEAKIFKDGKSLLSKDVEVVVAEDRVTFKFKKPSRAQSGDYEFKFSNAKGEISQIIPINMQGKWVYHKTILHNFYKLFT